MQVEKNKPSTSGMSEEIQKIADKIKSDVEKELNQVFKKFQVTESEKIKNENEPDRTSYNMKIKTDDQNQSNLRLKTTKRDPESEWLTSIDEFFTGMSPFEDLLHSFDTSRTGFSSIQKLADRIRDDVEKSLNRHFDMFDVMEYHPILTDPEHTSYYMRVKTDDNGHVRVKTIKKLPGSDWQTHVEEYNRGLSSLEGTKKKELEGKKREQPIRGEQMGKSKMEVEQGQGLSK